MARWLTDEEQRAWRAWRRMTLLVESQVARDLQRDSGLSAPDYLVLSTLSESVGARRRVTDLAVRMQWSASRLSHHVTRMEARGLVARTECPEDLRAAYVVLTDAGWDTIRAAAPMHVASVRDALVDVLDADDLTALTRIGEKVARRFGEGCLDRPADEVTHRSDGGPADQCGAPAQSGENAVPVNRS